MRYVPQKSPTDARELRAYLEREFQAIARAVNSALTQRPSLRVDPREHGFDEDATAAVNATAINLSVLEALELGGAIIELPQGTFAIDPCDPIPGPNVYIEGQDRATVLSFNPAAPAVLFDFDNGAGSVLFCGVSSVQFHSSNSVQKTAIRCVDGRSCKFEDLKTNDSGWPGAGSIGIHMHGRDSCVFRKNQLRCARPVVFDTNPNEPDIQTDFFLISDNVDGSTSSGDACYDFLDGVTLTNVLFEHNATVLGKWGVRYNDTSSTHASYNVMFYNNRWEQASDATGFCIELTSTAQRIQEVSCIGSHFDVNRCGLKVRNAERVTLIDSQFASPTLTHIDMEFESYSKLEAINTFHQVGGILTLTDGKLVRADPYNTAETAASKNYAWLHTNRAEPWRLGVPLGLTDGITAPAAIAGVAQIYVDVADGDLKVRFGDGTIKTLATDT